MKFFPPVLALALATGFPLVVSAQQSTAPENGPPPAVRAQMQQARDGAKTAALNDLSAGNRAKVQAIFDQIDAGQLTDLRAAAQQIDAILTPAEAKAVLAEREKLMQTMRASMPARPDGMAPNGPPSAPNGGPGADGDHPRGAMMGGSGAGRFLLSLGVSREKMRALRDAQRPQPGMSAQPH